MSFDAVALLRIPGFTPPEELDVRELDDGFLLFLDVPFEDDAGALLDALVEALGEALVGHEDERGIFVLPDAAEPEDAETYEAVISAVGSAGMFVGPEDDAGEADPMVDAHAVLGQMLESLGVGSMEGLTQALQTGDQDALKLAQIRMMGALERAMSGAVDSPAGAVGAEGATGAEGEGDDPAGRSGPGER